MCAELRTVSGNGGSDTLGTVYGCKGEHSNGRVFKVVKEPKDMRKLSLKVRRLCKSTGFYKNKSDESETKCRDVTRKI